MSEQESGTGTKSGGECGCSESEHNRGPYCDRARGHAGLHSWAGGVDEPKPMPADRFSIEARELCFLAPAASYGSQALIGRIADALRAAEKRGAEGAEARIAAADAAKEA
jgi:hypothetical protein